VKLMKELLWKTLRAVLPVALLAAAGCSSLSGDELRLARYRPIEHGRKTPAAALQAAGTAQTFPSTNLAAIPPVTTAATNAINPAIETPVVGGGRTLRKGDKIVISRKGIVREDEIKDVIDENGEVNLPLIGHAKLDGLTTSEAEDLIEDRYIGGQFYRKITVIVVAQEDDYYIRGEVTRPGKYPMSVGLTLLRAVVAAGGYTDFANPRKITLMRGQKVTVYDARKIEENPESDPAISPEDVIVVRQKWTPGS
jgi:polysaccharide biosynthesis/export protein VpsN